MKPEEAIKKLKYMKICYEEEIGQCSGLGDREWKEHIDMCNVAIQALEKQIAKKPDITHYNGYCGNCNKAWGKKRVITESHSRFEYFQYCPTCGQRIDWSVEE